MQMSQAQPGTQSPTRYHMSNKVLLPRMYVIVAILIGVPVFMQLAGDDLHPATFLVFGGMIVFILLLVWWITRITWIQMDANGITYKAWGFRVSSTWDNVASIGKQFMVNEGEVEGLKLYESGLDAHGALRAGSWFSWQSTVMLRTLETFIPLSNFQTREWRETPFGQEMRRYVPRLFKDESWG